MQDFKELAEKRFSARLFTDAPISDTDLKYILETTRLAPSACNKQPWKFLIIKSQENKAKLWECYDRSWFKTAPMYIVCMKNIQENWIRPYDKKPHGDIDVAIATEHLCLAATELGIGSCWVCNFDTVKMGKYFDTSEFEAVAIIPLGHIATDCPQNEKKRKELRNIVEVI